MSAVASSAEFGASSSADSGQGKSPGDVCSLAPTDAADKAREAVDRADKAREAVDRAIKRLGLSQITFTLKHYFSAMNSLDSIIKALKCL